MSWIKVRVNLHEDPRVLGIAAELAVRVPEVVGLLVRLWSYADAHSTDGRIEPMSRAGIDAIVGRTGFCDALATVGWISEDGDAVTLPRYADHNGQTAKQRAQTARAVTRHRMRKSEQSAGDGVTRGEERRGEKTKTRGASQDGGDGWI